MQSRLIAVQIGTRRLTTSMLVGASDGVHHGLDTLPRLDASRQYLLGRQEEAVAASVAQFHRVDVRNASDAGRPVAGVARRTVCQRHSMSAQRWRSQDSAVGGKGVHGQSSPTPKAHSILRISGCHQTMHNFVYLAKLLESLVKHQKNPGCSACFKTTDVTVCRAIQPLD